jgi:3-mercaptopyruvate sulfurtransferase SseA
MLHRRTLPVLALITFLLGALGCQGTTSDKDIRFVDVAGAQKLVRGSRGVLGMGQSNGVYVDPRGMSEYTKGHIPGAISLPFVDVQQEHKKLNDYAVIIVYGNDYGDEIGKIMAKRLIALKHDDVLVLDGGLRAWEQAGNAVETGPPPAP